MSCLGFGGFVVSSRLLVDRQLGGEVAGLVAYGFLIHARVQPLSSKHHTTSVVACAIRNRTSRGGVVHIKRLLARTAPLGRKTVAMVN